jgi:uncharacterized protein (TIGR03437 family)
VHLRSFYLFFTCLMLAGSVAAPAQKNVFVNFDPSVPAVGPFPTDFLTISDATQKTGHSIHLPMPDCAAQPSACTEVSLLNQLDGFALSPRIAVNFSGAIDATTLAVGIVIVWLNNLTTDEPGLGPTGQITAINQVIFDPATNTAYAKPNGPFDQHRRYALLVTNAVLDTNGNPVAADPKFLQCVQTPSNAYCTGLQQTLSKLTTAALPGQIVGASIFTTMSATAWLESARDLLSQVAVGFQSAGPSVKTSGLSAITLKAQVTTNPATFQTFTYPTAQPPTVPQGGSTLAGVDRIVFGAYQSPNFLNTGQYIPATGTADKLALPSSNNTISFHAYIPSSAMPSAGYPVIIWGHGYGDHSYLEAGLLASTFAQAGFATLAINAVGHGYGPKSVVQLVQGNNIIAEVSSGGRGVDLAGDGQITSADGCFLVWPFPVAARDCLRQTVVDLMQLENLIRSGTRIEPASELKLDPGRIYYGGDSFGAMYGTAFMAVDPNVTAGVLNVGGGSTLDITRVSAIYRSLALQLVSGYQPSLLNAGTSYNENYVFRDQPPVVNGIAGAIDLQNLFENLNWLQAAGDPLWFAPHLRSTPLANVPVKSVLFQYGAGDQSVPNPQSSALVRGAAMFDKATLYRADRIGTALQLLGQPVLANYNPHGMIVDTQNPATSCIAAAAQQQAAGFLQSNGATIPDANKLLQGLFPVQLTTPMFETPGRDLETVTLSQQPTINTVVSATGTASSVQPNIQAGSWVAIYGSNLASTTADWTGLITNGKLPTSVGGVSVTIGGKPAFIYAVIPNQVNLQAPDVATGDVEVVVTNQGADSPPFKVHLGGAAPAFFQLGASKYAIATRYPDNALVANPSLGTGFVGAKAGDILTLWATGFGQTTPVQPSGVVTNNAPTVAQTVTVTVGGIAAEVIGAVLSPGFVGLYQVAIRLPSGVPTGDVLIKTSVAGLSTPDNVYLFIVQ